MTSAELTESAAPQSRPLTPIGRHEVYQTSIMSALLDGVYEGETTVGDLMRRGDFGIGTFNALDGEMVVLDGVCYRLRSDGSVSKPAPDEFTPYAVVTEFVPHLRHELTAPMRRSEVSAVIDRMTASENYMYGLKIHGRFREVVTRTVVKQQKPYRPMVEATDDDAMLHFTDVAGTVVAFRTPLFEQGLSVPGCHAHFLTDDHVGGGHILDFTIEYGVVELCLGTDLQLHLPLSDAFQQANLAPDDLHKQLLKTEAHE